MAVICLGEALVDLVCEGEVESIGEAESFVPHFGGALANVSVAAARGGAQVELAGGAGADPWGRWLRERLAAEGVGLRFFSLVEGLQTPLAFITFDSEREPAYVVYGAGIEAGLGSLEHRVGELAGAATALVFGSNTLVSESERELTLAAREAALDRDAAIVFDPNIREHRWRDLDEAIERCRELCEGATVVRANRTEALRIAGLADDGDPRRAAAEIHRLGAAAAVVTLGAEGAVAAGACACEVPAAPAEMRSPLGAGDAFLGAMSAALDRRGWDLAALPEAIAAGAEAGAQACSSWGAVA